MLWDLKNNAARGAGILWVLTGIEKETSACNWVQKTPPAKAGGVRKIAGAKIRAAK
jgi:hypothetical protein